MNMKTWGSLNLKLCESHVWQACAMSTFSCRHWGNPLMNFDPWTRLPIEPILKRSAELSFRRLQQHCDGMRAGQLYFILGRSEILLFAATWDRLQAPPSFLPLVCLEIFLLATKRAVVRNDHYCLASPKFNPLKTKVNLCLSFCWTWLLSRGVPADSGFLCVKVALSVEMIKGTLCFWRCGS